MKPERGDSSWSNETHCPGAVSVWMAFACIPLVRHRRLVMATYMHPLYLGDFMLTTLLGIIPNRAKILILLKGKCPSL